MKVRDIMTNHVVRIGAEEPVEVAARAFAHYNVGMLPVCGADGRLRGVVTDRDLVTRCIAAERSPEKTRVADVMTVRVISAAPDMEASAAAFLMGREQIRRLPVLNEGRLCGMVSIGDLAGREETSYDAAEALGGICTNLSPK